MKYWLLLLVLAARLPAPPAAWAQPSALHLAPPAEQALRLAVAQLRRGLAQDQARRHPVPGTPHAAGPRLFFLAEAANKITLAYAPATAPGQQAGRAYAVRYHRLTQHWGLFDNDAADVLAAYLLLSWQVVHNAPDTTAVAQAAAQGLRVQTASVLARHLPTTAAAAQFGEQLKRHAVLLHRGWQQAGQGPAGAAYRQRVAASWQAQYHLDLRTLHLTAQGLNQP